MQPSPLSAAVRTLVFGGLAALSAFLTAGCQTSVKIEVPARGDSKTPVKTFRVRFHNDVDPSTFSATLNGQNITTRFQPAAAPGGVSTASSDFMEDPANTGQVLEVHALFKTPQAGIPTRSTGDRVEFSPPFIYVYFGNTTDNTLPVKERESIRATVLVLDPPPGEGLSVTLTTDENPAVSLNNAPAGTPVTVTIPSNDRRADFIIRGIQANRTFVIRPLAHGYVSRLGSGTVYPAN